MHLESAPQALPGCCFKCSAGMGSREFFIDFEFSMDFYGAVYICNECLTEMAHTAGFITPVEAEAFKKQIAELETDKFQLEVRLQGLERGLDGLRTAGYLADSTFNHSNQPDSLIDLGVPDRETHQVLPTGEEDVGSGTDRTPESDDDQDVGELRSGSKSKSFSLDI